MARGRVENLVNASEWTEEQRRERTVKGGIASGEARRAKRTLKEELIALLETEERQEKISLALIQKALKGDTKAFEVIRDTIGEKPKDEVTADQTITIKMGEGLEEYSE